jgi:hypothetical protein
MTAILAHTAATAITRGMPSLLHSEMPTAPEARNEKNTIHQASGEMAIAITVPVQMLSRASNDVALTVT